MKLARSAWKSPLHVEDGDQRDDYILVLPEDGAIVVFVPISTLNHGPQWAVWACRMREEDGSLVLTALANAKNWRRESYDFRDGKLHWNTGIGQSVWELISEEQNPEKLHRRAEKALEKLNLSTPPPYPNGE